MLVLNSIKQLAIITTLITFGLLIKNTVNNQYPSENLKSMPSILVVSHVTSPIKLLNTIDISQVSFYDLTNLTTVDYEHPGYDCGDIHYKIQYQGRDILHPQLAPDNTNVGFYLAQIEDDGNIVSLVVMNMETKDFKTVYIGNYKTSNWEWRDNENVIVYYNCGTGCHYAFVYTIKDSRLVDDYLEYPPKASKVTGLQSPNIL